MAEHFVVTRKKERVNGAKMPVSDLWCDRNAQASCRVSP